MSPELRNLVKGRVFTPQIFWPLFYPSFHCREQCIFIQIFIWSSATLVDKYDYRFGLTPIKYNYRKGHITIWLLQSFQILALDVLPKVPRLQMQQRVDRLGEPMKIQLNAVRKEALKKVRHIKLLKIQAMSTGLVILQKMFIMKLHSTLAL